MTEGQRDHNEEVPGEISPTPPLPEPPPRRRFGWITIVLSWLLITALVCLVVLGQARPERRAASADEGEDKLNDAVFELQVRYLLGAAEFLRGHGQEFYDQAKTLDRGSLRQRLRFVIVAGDLAGPAEARRQISDLRKQMSEWKVQPTKEESKLLSILDALYRDYGRLQYNAPSLSAQDRALLQKEFGWLGELALNPDGVSREALIAAAGALAPGALGHTSAETTTKNREKILEPATRTFFAIIGAVLFAFMLGVFGFAGLVFFVVLMFAGKLRAGIQCGISYGNIYAETFALWMLLFFGLSLAAHFIVDDLSESLLPAAGAMLFSLAVLVWPLIRGVSWRQLREDIGWTAGRQPLLEPVIGVGCYAMSLPLLGVGVVLTLILMALQQFMSTPGVDNPFSPGGYPAHPIIEKLSSGGFIEKLQIIFLASVVAPVVEETMFRGVLYRHLRELTCGWGRVLSIFISGTLVSFVFAIIHPQGWVATPALMSLAYGFTIAREWRGTLIPCMVGHGLSNGLVTTLVIFALG